MKKITFLIFAVFVALTASAQTEPASYSTVVNKFKQFYNSNQPDSIYKMFGPEMKSALTSDKWATFTTQLKTQLGYLTQTNFTSYTSPAAIYKATFQNGAVALSLALNNENKITGLYLKPIQDAATTQTNAAIDPSLTESPVSVKTFEGVIHGTLTMPKNASGKIPVVLIIPGSGGVDRNGNGGGLNGNIYKLLATELGKKGVASLRYDKRLVGESVSSTKESQLKIEDYVEDAVSLIHLLNDDKRFSKLFVFGHSEGSLVGMLALHDEPVKGFISAAGAGRSGDKILTEQMKSQPYYISEGFKKVLDSLKRGKLTPDVDPALYSIARPSVQPYLMSWCKYDPQRVMKKVKVPALILQGTTDIQVTVADAELLKKAKSDATLLIIPGMNHIFKEAPADRAQNIATYSKPELPLKPELVNSVVDFINKTP